MGIEINRLKTKHNKPIKETLPWGVSYNQRFPEWDEKAQPHIVDNEGNIVIQPFQTVDHPGWYDREADEICKLIVEAVNHNV